MFGLKGRSNLVVTVNYSSNKAAAEQVVSEIAENGGKALAVQANMAKKDQIEDLFAKTKEAFGQIDILVNNAGVYELLTIEEITEEHFHKQFDLNVLGLLLASQQAVRHFDDAPGCIINISSAITTSTPPASSVYTATKGGR